MSRKLYLIRHAAPEKIPTVPARHWPLSNQARLECQTTAGKLAKAKLAHLISSVEPKAVETGHIISMNLDLPLRLFENLHEHSRTTVPFLPDKKFKKSVKNFFNTPDELVFGEESATTVLKRFSRAVENVVEACPEGNIGIVTHGSVMTLLISRHNQIKPFRFWRALPMLGICVLSLPDYQLISN